MLATILATILLFQGPAPPWMCKTISGINVQDVDLGNGDMLMTLSVDRGFITLAATQDLQFIAGDGLLDARVQFTGKLDAVNAAIATVTYTMASPADKGVVVLTVNANDQGFTGLGGPMEDEKYVSIPLPVINQAPVITVPAGPDA